MTQTKLKAHVALAAAMIFFGLMSPLVKDASNAGLTGLQLATLRVGGTALLFWLAMPFAPRQKVARRDIPKVIVAGLLAVAICQSSFVVGVSMTSPVNASIEVTSQPIFALLLAAMFLGERITWRKALGVVLGCAGAIILILQVTTDTGQAANFRGDLVILGGQLAFAMYLTLFPGIISRYNLFTLNRWMFTVGTIVLLPFTWSDMAALDWSIFTPKLIFEVAYLVVCATFLTFVLIVYAQRSLSATVVSIYNYIQPVVTVTASLLMGVATFSWQQAMACVLVFMGVWLVIKARPGKH